MSTTILVPLLLMALGFCGLLRGAEPNGTIAGSILDQSAAAVPNAIPPTGTPNIGSSMVAGGGLVFISASYDGRFRAFDKDTGMRMWVTKLPASGFANPMSFKGRKSGKQFAEIAAGGGNKYDKHFSDELVAYTLP